MSGDVVIRAEGLGKKYVIGHQSSERYVALRDVIARSAKTFARTAMDMVRGRAIYAGDELEEFWALKDVNFEIRQGEVVGIIGRNGAGKSTLLKILSRITEPSTGRVEIKGRVASLLEVGTGFHPELTGRENIFLNGAILGMTHAEIQRKFDEIVDFAEVEKFLDTPVKRYSSGMYVRLAFAVAAHLEPEILIVDEVLAVGDAEFQKKCLGKMQDVAGHGRTVLFVSHNMAAMKSLCRFGLLLEAGRVVAQAETDSVIQKYLRPRNNPTKNSALNAEGANEFCITNVNIEPAGSTSSNLISHIVIFSPISEEIEIRYLVKSSDGTPIGIASIGGFGAKPISIPAGQSEFVHSINVYDLAQGGYVVEPEVFIISARRVVRWNEFINVSIERSPLKRETVYLKQEWGIGVMRFPVDPLNAQ